MTKFVLLLLTSFSLASRAPAQSDIKMRVEYGSDNPDLMSVLYFEDIGLGKVLFSGNDLKGKDFQISVKEFSGGKLARAEVVFDSTEDAYFKIKSDKFSFRVLAKVTSESTAKFQFQFDGFSKQKEYKVAAGKKEFALKSFLGGKPDLSVPLKADAYILTYMMPYVRKDGSTAYCEVAQSGVNPEELGAKYAIPTYFLIAIKFL